MNQVWNRERAHLPLRRGVAIEVAAAAAALNNFFWGQEVATVAPRYGCGEEAF